MSGIKKAGDSIEKIAETIECYLVLLISLILPASVGVFVLSDELVMTLLGDKWAAAGQLLKPLAIMGFFVGATAVLTAAMNAMRKVKSTFYLEFVIAITAVFILYNYRETDILIFSMVVAMIGLITFVCYLSITYYYVRLSIKNLTLAILPVILATSIMFLCLEGVKSLYLWNGINHLLILIIVGIVSYALSFYALLLIISDKFLPLSIIKSKVDTVSSKLANIIHKKLNNKTIS
jgi:O-antigen/teichoic acid export membrane protein